MFEIMSDGEDRAEITNELFDKLEGWIQDAENEASTTYQKELYVNNLLCVENEYEWQYEKPPEGGLGLVVLLGDHGNPRGVFLLVCMRFPIVIAYF